MRMNRAFSMLGIAAKSGNVASGEFATESAVKSGKAYLVVIAEDASDNTKKMFRNMTEFYQVPMELLGTKEELGRAIGKEFRASLAITDENLAGAVQEKIEAYGRN